MGVGLWADEGLCGLLGLLVDLGAKILSIVKREFDPAFNAVAEIGDCPPLLLPLCESVSVFRELCVCFSRNGDPFPVAIRPMICTGSEAEEIICGGGDGLLDSCVSPPPLDCASLDSLFTVTAWPR